MSLWRFLFLPFLIISMGFLLLMPMKATAEFIPSREEQIYKASKKDANGVG